MGDFIWYGTLFGAIAGFLHFIQTLIYRLGKPGLGTVKTFWQALWTWALWTLFGAYVLAFWIIGLVLWLIARVARTTGAAT